MRDAGTVIHGLEADHWVLTASPYGPQVAHESEVRPVQSLGACQPESRQVEELMEAEMSDELAFLVDQRMSLSPPAAGSMPYIS